MRASQRDFLWAFKKYNKGNQCYYVNAFTSFRPSAYKDKKFDLVILTWSFLHARFMRSDYLDILSRFSFLADYRCPVVMMPQDEFSLTDLLCETINKLKVTHLFTVSPLSELSKIYRGIDLSKLSISRFLTGYIDQNVVKRIEHLNSGNKFRPIDIGYRSGSAAYWGRFNLIKFELAEKFIEISKKYNLTTNIKFGWKSFLLGDDWYRFLLKCRFIPGVEGGSSIIDWDGSLVERVQKFLSVHESASYDEVEKNCIPEGKDGEINVVALSPRHLEACITKTCQILIEGDYNGILRAGIHYIELKKDFSNIEQVAEQIKDENLRLKIVEQAYYDIVASERYTYASMVEEVFSCVSNSQKKKNKFSFFFIFNKINDRASLLLVFLFSRIRDLRDLINSH